MPCRSPVGKRGEWWHQEELYILASLNVGLWFSSSLEWPLQLVDPAILGAVFRPGTLQALHDARASLSSQKALLTRHPASLPGCDP
jgi:hypothetical protein